MTETKTDTTENITFPQLRRFVEAGMWKKFEGLCNVISTRILFYLFMVGLNGRRGTILWNVFLMFDQLIS